MRTERCWNWKCGNLGKEELKGRQDKEGKTGHSCEEKGGLEQGGWIGKRMMEVELDLRHTGAQGREQ